MSVVILVASAAPNVIGGRVGRNWCSLRVNPRDVSFFPRVVGGQFPLLYLIIFASSSSHSLHTLNSSYATDMSSQFRAATYQPGPTRIYQNPNPAPSNVAHTAPPPSQHQAPPSPPHDIGELAERARQSLGEDPRPFKTWLRIAENARRDAKSFQQQGDVESAFVEYAKAATILLEKIPAHSDYRILLTSTQRWNMGLVSDFYPMFYDCGPVGVYIAYGSKFILRVLRDFYLNL